MQLRVHWGDFVENGVTIAGLSADPPKTNALVRERKNLPFPLLSDESLELSEKIGLLHKKGHAGRNIAHPAALLVDTAATVVWTYQGRNIQERASPELVFNAIAVHLEAVAAS